LAAGAALQRVWLTAASKALVGSVITQPLHLTGFRARLVSELALPGVPQAIFRFGYPAVPAAPSPRLPLGELFPAEVEGVLHTEVQALAAGRKVNVGRIAGEEHAARPVVLHLPGGVTETSGVADVLEFVVVTVKAVQGIDELLLGDVVAGLPLVVVQDAEHPGLPVREQIRRRSVRLGTPQPAHGSLLPLVFGELGEFLSSGA
jgi:hypothetical protein